MSALAKTAGDIYISIIPFAKDVNVGASNYNQSWVDFTDWDNDPASPGTCSKNKTTKSTCEQSNENVDSGSFAVERLRLGSGSGL